MVRAFKKFNEFKHAEKRGEILVCFLSRNSFVSPRSLSQKSAAPDDEGGGGGG